MTYPHEPGYKEYETSRAAAERMMPRAGTLAARCLTYLRRWGQSTPDEAATYFGESILAIRPRFSELKEKGLIEDTGLRRKNRSGNSAKVWRVKEDG